MKPFAYALTACLLATTAMADDSSDQDRVRSDLVALSSFCAADDEERILRRHECRRLIRAAVAKLDTFKGIELGDKNVRFVPAVASK